MSKVMLVEDDNNLREIYEARLAAEGYEIISAADGEAALALAIKEKPDLIISDIMMPKVSGFDMLDILRSTTETKNSKIIMMTALNQAEDKARAEKLGADLYLVKSQVTLEDVVRSAKNLLGEQTPLSVGGIPVEQPAATAKPAANATSLTANAPAVPTPTAPAAAPAPAPASTPTPVATPAPAAPTPPPAPVAPAPAEPTPVTSIPVTSPPDSPAPAPATPVSPAQPASPSTDVPVGASTEEEEAALQAQIENFITTDAAAQPTAPAAAPAPAPASTPTPVATPAPAAPTPPPAPVAPAPPQIATAPTMAPPPSSESTESDPTTNALPEDKPAGEQVIVKSAPPTPGEGGIDASISGRKKVIQPISDVMNHGPDLNSLLAKEPDASQPNSAPALNAVITPDGMTMSGSNGTPTMNDVIAPNPQAAQTMEPKTPPPPPVA